MDLTILTHWTSQGGGSGLTINIIKRKPINVYSFIYVYICDHARTVCTMFMCHKFAKYRHRIGSNREYSRVLTSPVNFIKKTRS